MVSLKFTVFAQLFVVALLASRSLAAEPPLLGNGKNCTVPSNGPDPCDQSLGLICNGTCHCEFGNYNNNTSRCVVDVNDTCNSVNPIDFCVGNSKCFGNVCICNEYYKPNGKECIPTFGQTCEPTKSDCNSDSLICNGAKKCSCKEGSKYNGTACVDSLGSKCNPKNANDCNTNSLICNNATNICTHCNDFLDYSYNPQKKSCVLRIGVACPVNATTGIQCSQQNTECPKTGDFTGVCACKGDHTPNLELTDCLKGHNVTCETDLECNLEVQGLVCAKSVNDTMACQCKTSQEYCSKRDICVSKENKRCTLNQGGEGSSKVIQCKEGLSCQKVYISNTYSGICKSTETSGAAINTVFYPLLVVLQLYGLSLL